MNPDDLKYTEEHEWIKIEGNEGIVGVTDYAQESLGDIVFVELPLPGDEFDAEEGFGVIESVKAVSDLYMPVSGKVIEVNDNVLESPELVNEDPYGKGWLIKIEITGNKDKLLNAQDYEKFLARES
ncbi:MAG: glycine cleavage system protein [Clostridia bacterium]|jgi:glycine cleavage system H protein|nr:gcvH [Clostridiales bacterium]MDK2986378.1 glycine cleavage system protein [Clostridia bacterium]